MVNNHSERWRLIEELFHSAFELPENERGEFLERACRGDASLRAEIEELIETYDEAESFMETPPILHETTTTALREANEEALAGVRLGAYEVIREIGRGGMGTVYLAARADEEFRKRVAIKLITAGFDHESIIQRFRNERQILAGLDHPNIARLLDGGTTESGAPYFVMEYIEGQTIREYCDSHCLTTNERLKLFRTVCSAVHFAHQNLVVHRDIKPANILVTADGTARLLDFGVAKLLSPTAHAGEITEVTSQVMTPEYASPEQARGEIVTTASDVYSLGVLLYELLTGHRPYSVSSRSLIEVVQAICEQEPLRPSTAVGRTVTPPDSRSPAVTLTPETVAAARRSEPKRLRRELQGDLDNIVLKALRKEPQRRYASVEQFSEDIQRYFQRLPVIARQDSLSYRTTRFVSRHKAGVAAAALVVVALLVGAVTTLWQAHAARQERDKAEHRFNQVRKLANAVLFDYHDGIEKLPGSTPIREKMVKDALEYLDNLSAESSDDDTLQRELASAYEKVGDVQGAPYRANLGNYAGALISHNKALTIRTRLNSPPAESPQLRLELARSYAAVGELSQVTGDIPAALENYGRAFAVFDSLSNEGLETERELSILHVRFGRALRASGELTKALDHFRQGIAITRGLSSASPGDQRLHRDLAFASIFLGDALKDSGDLKEALAAQRTAFALLEPLVNQTNAQSRRDVAVAQQRIGEVLEKLGDKRGSLEIGLKLLIVDEELARADPSNALARRDLYIDHYKIAFMQEAIGDLKSALANQRICLALCKAEVAANPGSSESRADLGVGYFRLAEMLENSGNLQQALVNYEKAVEIAEAISNADPSDKVARGDLSEDRMKVSDVLLKLGNKADALKGYLNALVMRQELVAAAPDDAEGHTQLARIYESLGAYYISMAATEKRMDDWREARRWYQQSLEQFQELQERNKLSSDYGKKPYQIKKRIESCNAVLAKL